VRDGQGKKKAIKDWQCKHFVGFVGSLMVLWEAQHGAEEYLGEL